MDASAVTAVPLIEHTSAEAPAYPDPAASVSLTLLYSQQFNYPLTAAELHRYYLGPACSPSALAAALDEAVAAGQVAQVWDHCVLAGQEVLVMERSHRRSVAKALWQQAQRYAALVAALPFVRMVAVTGALAMDNVVPQDDIDLLVVTAPGRLWLTRGLVVAVARLARLRGVTLCPNYLLTESNLTLARRDLFTAHELAQMAPLYGKGHYHALWRANPWVTSLLPNARPFDCSFPVLSSVARRVQTAAERLLSGRLGDLLERWEFRRKSARLRARAKREGGDVAFTPNECRGYFGGLEERVLRRYYEQAAQLQRRPAEAAWR